MSIKRYNYSIIEQDSAYEINEYWRVFVHVCTHLAATECNIYVI